MEINRDLYLYKLISKKNNGLIKIITGLRRCGKSYLLNTIFYRHLINNHVREDHIIRFAFDSASDLSMIGESLIKMEKENRKADPELFLKYINSKIVDNNTYYLLLDEVQNLDCFESVLNGYLHKENIDIYITGSNAKFLSKDIITEFAGRGDEIHMSPLSFKEFMSISNKDKYESFNEYMLYGGIPLVVLEENEQEKVKLLDGLFKETYISDICKRHNVKNIGLLNDILNILSSSIGSLTNPEKLMNTFKSQYKISVTNNTIRNYISYFEDSFLIDSSSRYDIKDKRYIDTPKKYYFSDLGLRNVRLNFRQIEKTHAMENIIYNELILRGYSIDVGVVESFEKNSNGNNIRKQLEIDFVCNLGFKRLYIQSAFAIPDEDKERQEIKPLKIIDDSFKKVIITGDNIPMHYNDEGILLVNIYDFLLDPELIESL